MDPLIITCAPVGAEITIDETPHLPYTPAKLAATAKAVREAGGSIVHVHCRTDAGENTHDVARFREAYEAIRAQTDIIVQFSTGGAIGMTPDERAAILQLRPEMATLTCGSVNFGDDIFENSFPIMRTILAKINEFGVRPELEIFDKGHLANARRLVKEGLMSFPQHVDFVLGVPGAMEASVANLCDLVDDLPAGYTCVSGCVSVARNSRWRSPQLQWAATCAWASKITCITARGALRVTKSWSHASLALRRRPGGRWPHPTRPGASWESPRLAAA